MFLEDDFTKLGTCEFCEFEVLKHHSSYRVISTDGSDKIWHQDCFWQERESNVSE